MVETKEVVAVTGGTGFLGRYLVPALRAAGYEVRLLTREAMSLEGLGATALIHAAGLVGYERKLAPSIREANVALTAQLLGAAREAGISRFVHVSSIVTLGVGRELRNESSPYNASFLRLPYFDTKAEAEELALAANGPGFEVIVVNPGTFVGVGEKTPQLGRLVGTLARLPVALLPDGGSDFVDVADVAAGVVAALQRGKPGERYVLGAENLNYAQLYRKIRSLAGRHARPIVLPRVLLSALERALSAIGLETARLRRVNGVFLFHDSEKARRELGYAPRPIEQALSRVLEEQAVDLKGVDRRG